MAASFVETLLGVVGSGVGVVVVVVAVVVVGVVVVVVVVLPPVVDAFVVVGAVPAFLAAPRPLPPPFGAEAVVVVGAVVVAPDAVVGAEAFGPPAFGFFGPALAPWPVGAVLVVLGAPPLGAFAGFALRGQGRGAERNHRRGSGEKFVLLHVESSQAEESPIPVPAAPLVQARAGSQVRAGAGGARAGRRPTKPSAGLQLSAQRGAACAGGSRCFRHWLGGVPTTFLKARLKAASDS